MHKFSCASSLELSAEEFIRALTLGGVNRELRPLVRMTAPDEWASRPILDWPEQQALFSSWILFLGILPVDRHSFYLESIKPDRGFSEQSSSTVNSIWLHERKVVAIPSGCRVTDNVEFQCRLPLAGIILKQIYRLVFLHRHRNLRAMYGGCAGP